MRYDIRRTDEHHHATGDWFDAHWHFSFGGWHDPDRMGVGPLRVFNDDEIVAGAQWPMHPHADIESLTWVASGHFEHADSLGNGGTLEAGGAQVMRFSHRGAQHSERNASDEEPVRFIQFWILPSREDLENSVQQRQWTQQDRTDRWLRIMTGDAERQRASGDAERQRASRSPVSRSPVSRSPVSSDPSRDGGALELVQDATVDVSRMTADIELTHTFAAGRGGYLYVLDGTIELDGTEKLKAGDALAVTEVRDRERTITLRATEETEVLLVDVPLEWEPVGIWRGRV